MMVNLQSDFFRVLEEKKCWWVIKTLESQNPDVNRQLEKFDNIAYSIETSSCHNKRLLHTKCEHIINQITPGRTDFVISRKLQPISLPELYEHQPGVRNILESAYAENVFRASVLSEIRVFDELTKLNIKEIKFLEEESKRKTPDFKVVYNGQNIFVEVKCINPEKEEEQKMMFGLVEFVELNSDWWEKVKKKLSDALKDAKAKFEAVNAYAENCKRWVYVSIIWWSADASSQHEAPEKLITATLIHEFEMEFGVELKFFKTF